MLGPDHKLLLDTEWSVSSVSVDWVLVLRQLRGNSMYHVPPHNQK